jgi:hypothetical protein
MSLVVSGLLIVFIQIGEFRDQRIRLELFRTFESLFTIEHQSGQSIFNNYRKVLWLAEGCRIVLMVDRDSVIRLTDCDYRRANYRREKSEKNGRMDMILISILLFSGKSTTSKNGSSSELQ